MRCTTRKQITVIGTHFFRRFLGENKDQLRDIFEGTEYMKNCFYGEASKFWKDTRYSFGNAIVSRWPLLQTELFKVSESCSSSSVAIVQPNKMAILFTILLVNRRSGRNEPPVVSF